MSVHPLPIPENKKRGASDSLARGFVSHNTKLKNYALSRNQNTATVDDLVQETFLKTWKFIVRGGEIKMMEAFLYHVLNDLIVDDYRKRKPVSLELLLEKGFEPSEDERERQLNVFDGNGAFLLIDELPKNYRQVLHMRFGQGLTLSEISTLTGATKNAVAVQIHRGLARLRILYHRGQSM